MAAPKGAIKACHPRALPAGPRSSQPRSADFSIRGFANPPLAHPGRIPQPAAPQRLSRLACLVRRDRFLHGIPVFRIQLALASARLLRLRLFPAEIHLEKEVAGTSAADSTRPS